MKADQELEHKKKQNEDEHKDEWNGDRTIYQLPIPGSYDKRQIHKRHATRGRFNNGIDGGHESSLEWFDNHDDYWKRGGNNEPYNLRKNDVAVSERTKIF